MRVTSAAFGAILLSLLPGQALAWNYLSDFCTGEVGIMNNDVLRGYCGAPGKEKWHLMALGGCITFNRDHELVPQNDGGFGGACSDNRIERRQGALFLVSDNCAGQYKQINLNSVIDVSKDDVMHCFGRESLRTGQKRPATQGEAQYP